MDQEAASLLSILKRPAAPSESKINQLNALKSNIKHYRVPETAQATIFDCLKLAITQQASSTLANSAFSTLGHLIKRLRIQDASGHIIAQLAPRLFAPLQERLGDSREPVRTAASYALSELYPYFNSDIESIVQDGAIGGSNPRAKEAGMQWVVRMHRDEAMAFKAYVGPICACLEHSDGHVREAAKTAIIDLFADKPDRAKADLKRQLKAHSVRQATETQILSQIGATTASRPQTAGAPEPEVDLGASTRSLPTFDHVAHFANSILSEEAKPPPPETVPMDPLYVQSERELNDTFRDMLPHFEGKETEQNWLHRDKDVLKLRRLLKGNAPSDYHHAWMAGLKSMIEGILKVANSLRTTMSSNGCLIVQELARTLGPALDPHVEMFLQSTIKMCSNTKHIAAENGRITADTIFQHCTYHKRMMEHIWTAAQEKNAATRQCTPEWLKTILKRQAGYKSHFESSGGLDLAQKCITKGLDDANPKVKEGMRATYWTFARTWPDKADIIMSKLDPKAKASLEKDPNNPNAHLHSSQSSAVVRSTTPAAQTGRANIKQLIAEQRKAKMAAQNLPERPVSAMATLSPAKPRSNASNAARAPTNLSHVQRPETRIASTASNTSTTDSSNSSASRKPGSSLMSGPVRRPRRPEMQRPQTADPYASKRLLRPETPAARSPSNSPPKGTDKSKSSIPSTSASRNRAKTAGTVASPNGSPIKRSPLPKQVQEQRPSSKDSSVPQEQDLTGVREDDFTMVMPSNKNVSANRAIAGSSYRRPVLDKTMSVDSGLPAMVEEDGFTMVMPIVSNRPQRERSPLAYRSPLKAMFEEAREMADRPTSAGSHKTRGSVDDPFLDAGQAVQRRASPVKATTPQPQEVQIYEDPVSGDADGPHINGDRQVLGELPVNENVRVQSPTQSVGSSASPAGSPRHISQIRSPIALTPQDRAEVQRNRKLLGSGIERIRAKTLDAHGFRKVQDLAKSQLDIWDCGKKYDELMAVLLEYLQTLDQDPKTAQQPASKTTGLKAQALAVVRTLLALHRKSAVAWHAKALLTVLRSWKGVDAASHVVADLDKTADDIVKHAAPEPCIDAVLDYLPTTGSDAEAARPTALALTTLRQLLISAKQRSLVIASSQKTRLAQTAARYLEASDAEVRKADVDLASELFEQFGPSKTEFWSEFKGVDEGRLGLLTYYIARRGKATAQ